MLTEDAASIYGSGRLVLMMRKLNRLCIHILVEQLLTISRNLGGKNTALMKPGERIIVCTPGGGGYGPIEKADEEEQKKQKKTHAKDLWRGTGSIAAYQATQESA